MTLVCFLAIFAWLAGAVLSAALHLNYPEAGNVYKCSALITPTRGNDLMASSVDDKYATIVLAYGQRDNLTIDRIMTTRSVLNLGFYRWIIPATVDPRSDYVIEVGTDVSNIAFAGYITISQRNSVAAATTATTAASSAVTHKALGLS
ncbi:hypothetical protein MBANPS3_012110 [Mucor bainieri]